LGNPLPYISVSQIVVHALLVGVAIFWWGMRVVI